MSKDFIIEKIKQHKEAVNALAVSPDGRYLFSVSDDKQINGYWQRSWAFCMSMGHHTEGINCIAVSPDSKYLATGSNDTRVMLWEYGIVGAVDVYIDHSGPVTGVIFSADGKNVFSSSGGDDCTIKKWFIENGSLITTFPKLSNPITSLVIDSSGETLFATHGNHITVYRSNDGYELTQMQGHEGKISSICLSNDGKLIATASDDKKIIIWDIEQYHPIIVLVQNHPINSVIFSPDNKYLICGTGGNIGEIYIWEIETRKLIQLLREQSKSINSLVFSQDGKKLISASSDNSIIVWDFEKAIESETEYLFAKEVVEFVDTNENAIESDMTTEIDGDKALQEEKVRIIQELAEDFNKISELLQNEQYREALEKTNKALNKAKSNNLNDFFNAAQTIIETIRNLIENVKDLDEEMTEITQNSNLSLNIPIEKIKYDSKERRISIEILNFTFIGQYFKSTRLSEVLDDFHASLINEPFLRENVRVLDIKTQTYIDQNKKIKELYLWIKAEEKEENEELSEVLVPPDQFPDFPIIDDFPEAHFEEDYGYESEMRAPQPKVYDMEKEPKPAKSERKEDRGKKRMVSEMKDSLSFPAEFARSKPAAPVGMPSSPGTPAPPSSAAIPSPLAGASLDAKLSISRSLEAPQEKVHDINMGLQYYAVMMEQQTYLFYVYLSHKELVIQDEEGKTVYETTFQIVTTKEKPPQLDLRIEGEGFEIHPIKCTLVVDENAISQPVMIFSITALKDTSVPEKERKKGYRRFLHIIVDFEGKTVSHTVLSAVVQVKAIGLKLGPIQLNLTKSQAMMFCLLMISVSVISFIYTLSKMDFSTLTSGGGEGLIPGFGSLGAMASFMMTILKRGVFPIKKKVAGMLDFTKEAAMMK